jgi:hypothetical protein
VIALVSFDQQTHLDQNDWSWAYVTIVGAYVVKGSRHDVASLVDLAVVDPVTRQLVLRAGGTDLRLGNTTLIDADRELREADLSGFSAATDQMIDHFDAALTRFEADVRSGKAPIRIESKNARDGAGGGGAIDAAFIGLLLLTLALRAAGWKGPVLVRCLLQPVGGQNETQFQEFSSTAGQEAQACQVADRDQAGLQDQERLRSAARRSRPAVVRPAAATVCRQPLFAAAGFSGDGCGR